MRSGGWKSFWAAFWLTLLVLAPLVGGTILVERYQARQRVRSAAESQSGVPVSVPKAEDRLSALVCLSGEDPAFVLLCLDADQNSLLLLAIPGETAVPFGEGETTLAACYAAAGPARCVQGLNAALELEIERYLALSPEMLAKVTEGFGPVRVGFSGVLTAPELAACGLSEAVRDWTAESAHAFLAALAAGETGLAPAPETAAALRAALWEAFFRQKLELLPEALPAALRQQSSSLLTDLTAGDLYILEDTLEFLANNGAAPAAGTLPGEWDGEAGLYRLDETSRTAAQGLLEGVAPPEAEPASSLAAAQAEASAAPTEEQSESPSAP